MSKKQANVATTEEINDAIDRYESLSKELSEIDWKNNYDEWMKKETTLENAHEDIYRMVSSLKHSEVIQTIARATDIGVSPEGALDNWISSWC